MLDFDTVLCIIILARVTIDYDAVSGRLNFIFRESGLFLPAIFSFFFFFSFSHFHINLKKYFLTFYFQFSLTWQRSSTGGFFFFLRHEIQIVVVHKIWGELGEKQNVHKIWGEDLCQKKKKKKKRHKIYNITYICEEKCM